MVLINEIKYACQACIKGHRSSGCTHTERPLFEIKKKGRPTTQCNHCRELRKSKQVHVKCMCAAAPQNAAIASPGSASGAEADGNVAETEDAAVDEPKKKLKAKKKKKDFGAEQPAFPNGLKDYHEMKEAAEALNGLLGTTSGPTPLKANLDSLLNPCLCLVGGECNCCCPRTKPKQPPSDANPSPPGPQPVASAQSSLYESRNSSLENLADNFSSSIQMPSNSLPAPLRNFQPTPVASTSTSSSSSPSSSMPPPASTAPLSTVTQSSRRNGLIPNYPYHTSASVHKTALYTPYGKKGGNARESSKGAPTSLPSPKDILASTANRNLRELVGNYVKAKEKKAREESLPSFDRLLTGEGETHIGKELGLKENLIVMSGCTCGENCNCPSCVEHDNAPMEGVEAGDHLDCPDNCSSCFGCTKKFAVPANINTIEALIAATASSLPEPPTLRQNQFRLDGTNVTILPHSALWSHSKESKEAFGLRADLPKLECCSGNCRCFPNECTCMKDCCGCCGGCGCEEKGKACEKKECEKEGQGEGKGKERAEPAKSCCSKEPQATAPVAPQSKPSSCCSPGGDGSRPASPPPSVSPVPSLPIDESTSSSCCSSKSTPKAPPFLSTPISDPLTRNPTPSMLSQPALATATLSRSSSAKAHVAPGKSVRKTINRQMIGSHDAHSIKPPPARAAKRQTSQPAQPAQPPPPLQDPPLPPPSHQPQPSQPQPQPSHAPPIDPTSWMHHPVPQPYPYPYPYPHPYSYLPQRLSQHSPYVHPQPSHPYQNGYSSSSNASSSTSVHEPPFAPPGWHPPPPQGYPQGYAMPYYHPQQQQPPPHSFQLPHLDLNPQQQAYLHYLATIQQQGHHLPLQQQHYLPPEQHHISLQQFPHPLPQHLPQFQLQHVPPSLGYATDTSQDSPSSTVELSNDVFESFLASLPSPTSTDQQHLLPADSKANDASSLFPQNDLFESFTSQSTTSLDAQEPHVEPCSLLGVPSAGLSMAPFEFDLSPPQTTQTISRELEATETTDPSSTRRARGDRELTPMNYLDAVPIDDAAGKAPAAATVGNGTDSSNIAKGVSEPSAHHFRAYPATALDFHLLDPAQHQYSPQPNLYPLQPDTSHEFGQGSAVGASIEGARAGAGQEGGEDEFAQLLEEILGWEGQTDATAAVGDDPFSFLTKPDRLLGA